MRSIKCQILNVNTMHESKPRYLPISINRRYWLFVARYPSIRRLYRIRHSAKKYLQNFFGQLLTRKKTIKAINEAVKISSVEKLTSGDLVRVRSFEEILITLDSGGRLKGCRFMPEMKQYCNTVQRVYKPLERFLNERDYTIRESKGLVLLENLVCQGNKETGRCDRSCFFFWRVEWLEKIGNGQ